MSRAYSRSQRHGGSNDDELLSAKSLSEVVSRTDPSKRHVLCNALFLFLAVSGLRAQVATVDATVVGALTDAQGAVIPGVTVTITSLATNIPQQTISDDEGRYRIAKLSPGEYRLLAELTGFKSFSIAKLILEVNQTARVDIRLEIGQVSDRVEVSSELSLLKTDTSELGRRCIRTADQGTAAQRAQLSGPGESDGRSGYGAVVLRRHLG